jgi:hypothetical protein
MPLLGYPAPSPPRPASVVGWNGSSPGCWSSSAISGSSLESSPAGLLGHFRRRRLAWQLAGLEGRMEELRARWTALPDGD